MAIKGDIYSEDGGEKKREEKRERERAKRMVLISTDCIHGIPKWFGCAILFCDDGNDDDVAPQKLQRNQYRIVYLMRPLYTLYKLTLFPIHNGSNNRKKQTHRPSPHISGQREQNH